MWTAKGERLEVATHHRFFTEVTVPYHFFLFSNSWYIKSIEHVLIFLSFRVLGYFRHPFANPCILFLISLGVSRFIDRVVTDKRQRS